MERRRFLSIGVAAAAMPALAAVGRPRAAVASSTEDKQASGAFNLIRWNHGMVIYGADYYPEAWSESQTVEDAKMMQAAGINFVRMGEFAWVKMEPEEGHFDFTWLDHALENSGRARHPCGSWHAHGAAAGMALR